MIKAALLDLDGTLVDGDTSYVVAELAGKRSEVVQNNQNFHKGLTKGLDGLIASINMFKGVTLDQVEQKLDGQDHLMPGAEELIEYFRKNGIVSILASGSILPVVEYFQRKLKIDYAIGSRPRIRGGVIQGISEEDFPDQDFKLYETKKILEALGIKPEETVAIGDSPGDMSRFKFAHKSIAINPKGGIEEFADYIIQNDLSKAVAIIGKLIK